MRPSFPLLAAVLAVLLPTADAAASIRLSAPGEISVSRRADPSLDPFMRTALPQTSLPGLTDNQRWLSTHARPLVVHDSDPAVSLNVTGWASKPKVAAYINATGVNRYRAGQHAGARKWLVKRKGKQVMVDGWEMIDIRKSAARKWWLYGSDGKASCHPDRDLRGALDLYACGYTSLWIDNALTTIHQGFKPTPKISDKSWGRGMLKLLRTLRKKKPKGTTFTINMHWTDSDFGWAKRPRLKKSSPLVKSAKLANQVVIEGGAIDPGLYYDGSTKHVWSFRRLLKFADALHKHRVKLQWEKTGSNDLTAKGPADKIGDLPSCRDGDAPGGTWTVGSEYWRAHVRTAAFNYAAALLTLRKGDGVGDMCEYPGRGWVGYEAHLGKPIGKRKDRGHVILRKFRGGMVAINVGERSVYQSLPGGKRGVDLAQLASPLDETPVSGVTIPPLSAAVIDYR